jgi:hypothetical protein
MQTSGSSRATLRARLATRQRDQPATLQPHLELPEEHALQRHRRDDRVEPAREQQFVVGRFAADLHCLQRPHACWVGDHGGQRQRGHLEGARLRRGDAAHTDVGAVLEMLPVRIHRRTPHAAGMYPPVYPT